MKIENLKAGGSVYDVGRRIMGNTTISTVSVWRVRIVSVDVADGVVVAEWNGNPAKRYYQRDWSKWRASEPMLIEGMWGRRRLATREEIKAARAAAP